MTSYDCYLIDINTYQCSLLVDKIYVGKCIFIVEEKGWIERLDIEIRYRNRGYGSLLLKYVESILRELGCRKIGLVAMPDEDSLNRSELQKFYYKNGFQCMAFNRETLEGTGEMVKLL